MSSTIEKRPGLRWLVARTRPRAEKKFAEYCSKREVTHYLPLRRSVRRYKRRVVTFDVPMFPGYIFVQIPADDYSCLHESFHFLCVVDTRESVEDRLIDDLNDLQRLEEATDSGEVEVRAEIVPGRTVRVETGPFMGLNGIVTRRKGKERITVNIDLIGQSVSVEMDVGEVGLE
jgi:transcription antitermination factor NusG